MFEIFLRRVDSGANATIFAKML